MYKDGTHPHTGGEVRTADTLTILPDRCSVCGERRDDLSLGVCGDCQENVSLCSEELDVSEGGGGLRWLIDQYVWGASVR